MRLPRHDEPRQLVWIGQIKTLLGWRERFCPAGQFFCGRCGPRRLGRDPRLDLHPLRRAYDFRNGNFFFPFRLQRHLGFPRRRRQPRRVKPVGLHLRHRTTRGRRLHIPGDPVEDLPDAQARPLDDVERLPDLVPFSPEGDVAGVQHGHGPRPPARLHEVPEGRGHALVDRGDHPAAGVLGAALELLSGFPARLGLDRGRPGVDLPRHPERPNLDRRSRLRRLGCLLPSARRSLLDPPLWLDFWRGAPFGPGTKRRRRRRLRRPHRGPDRLGLARPRPPLGFLWRFGTEPPRPLGRDL